MDNLYGLDWIAFIRISRSPCIIPRNKKSVYFKQKTGRSAVQTSKSQPVADFEGGDTNTATALVSTGYVNGVKMTLNGV